ncbi:MAG: DUF1573 domain-containing protein, partial [Planctomycetes bacterium]|nr:DUF1573 domain-containing protein [Planctomycetota bacterium]
MSGRSDREIKPGEHDVVSVTLASRGRSGAVQKGIRVTTNDPDNKQITLTCTGNVISAFSGEAPKATFGRIKRDQGPQTKTIRLSAGDAGPIKPEVGTITQEGLTAEIREIDPGKVYDLDVTVGPPWPNGRLIANLDLKTGVAKAPEEKIRIDAQIVPRVQAAPDQFMVVQNASAGTD